MASANKLAHVEAENESMDIANMMNDYSAMKAKTERYELAMV